VRRRFLVATFSNSRDLLCAVQRVSAENLRVFDVYSPYPIDGLDQAIGLRHIRLSWVTFIAGLGGAAGALTFQFYTAVLDWPLNVGGKPANSTLAFVPICFELTVLLGALSTMGAFLLRARLFPGKYERLPAKGVTNDTFALVIRKRDERFDLERAWLVLRKTTPLEIREIEDDL
jgi:Protein of unknown function (DUF3341)